MKTNITSIPRRAAAFALAVLLIVPTVFASAGEKKLQTSIDILDGLSYRNTVTVNHDSRVESFSMELKQDSPVYPILLQGSGAIYGTATINKAVSTAQGLGYHVVGAINTDFFSMSSGVPMGIVIENGVYKSNGDQENAMVIVDGTVSIMGHPDVSMTLTNHTTGNVVTPRHFNKLRSDTGGLYLFNQAFSSVSTRTKSDGWFVRMRLVDPQSSPLGVNSSLQLEVIELLESNQDTPIGADEYILSAANESGYGFVYSDFHVGDLITLETKCDDPNLSQAQWAGGVGDILIQDGAITDSSKWTYKSDGRQPRSAIGMKENGTLVMYAVDGRQSGYSIGLTEKDLADEMLRQGCTWAVNVDGGGSTALAVWLPGQSGSALQSQPSGGQPRGCATYLLLVTDERGDGIPNRLAMAKEGQVVLTGSRVDLSEIVALDRGLNLVSADLSGLTTTSSSNFGTVSGSAYTAGEQSGTDQLQFYTPDQTLQGTAQIHVVNTLTSLTISQKGSNKAISSIVLEPGEHIQLSVTGSYWGRTALRGWDGVTWTIDGDIGTMDDQGVFTVASKPGRGSITFHAGGLSQKIEFSPSGVHDDVGPDHWAYEAVEYCYENNIVSGISPTEFGRDAQIRRGDFILMIYNAMGKPIPAGHADFTDVSPDDYYYDALSWGQPIGLASGTGNGAYSPNAPVTREQAFTILRKALPLMGHNCPDGDLSILNQFDDQDQISDYARPHAATLVSQGIVGGKGTGIDPQGRLTRAEMAVILHKAMTLSSPSVPPTPQPEVDPSQYTLTLDLSEMLLPTGDSTTLNATLTPAYDKAVITWRSSNPDAAAVSSNGVVTNISTDTQDQTVTITASWEGLSATCTVTCTPPQLTGQVTDAEDGLNVRSGPDTTYSIVGRLENQRRVIVLGEENGWYQILYGNSQGTAVKGYVSGTYLTVIP